MESDRGKITGQFKVRCYRCCGYEKIKAIDLATAEDRLTSLEWKRSIYGWVCKECGKSRRI